MTPWPFSKLGFELCYGSLLNNFAVKWIISTSLIDFKCGQSEKDRSDIEDKNKNSVNEVFEKSNRTLSISIIRNKEAFRLHPWAFEIIMESK